MSTVDVGLRKCLHGFSFWTSTFCLSLSWTHVQGNLQLIGSSEPIVAAPGDDVLLPCRVDPEWDVVGKTVEWSRPDLRVPGSQKRVEYVYVYRFKRKDRDMMMETYVQRTSLSDEGLRRGDVSLRISNVSLEDNGRFRCFIPRLRIEAEVRLVVDPNIAQTTTTETVPLRNLIIPTPELETIRNDRRSRLLLCLPLLVFFFIVCLSSVSVCCLKKFPKNNKCYRNSVNQTPHLYPECFALQQACVHADGSSAESDSNQQLKPHGEDLSPPDPSESGSSCGCSQTPQESPKPSDQRSITPPRFPDMKRTPVDGRLEKKPGLIRTSRSLLAALQVVFSLRTN